MGSEWHLLVPCNHHDPQLHRVTSSRPRSAARYGTVTPLPVIPHPLSVGRCDESRQLAQEADPQRLPGNVSIFRSSALLKSAQDGANHNTPPSLLPLGCLGGFSHNGREIYRAVQGPMRAWGHLSISLGTSKCCRDGETEAQHWHS